MKQAYVIVDGSFPNTVKFELPGSWESFTHAQRENWKAEIRQKAIAQAVSTHILIDED